MDNLKPTSFEISLSYQCPKCQTTYYFTKDEVKYGISFVCCGQVWQTPKISNIKVIYQINKQSMDSPEVIKALSVLKDVWYKKGAAKSVIKTILEKSTKKLSVEELVKLALASG